ncbi:MAG TPA: hypothetical protein ENK27_05590 [Desulfobulbus sp.]|nr:hypothetical protein [Desulfobulbus sp.]
MTDEDLCSFHPAPIADRPAPQGRPGLTAITAPSRRKTFSSGKGSPGSSAHGRLVATAVGQGDRPCNRPNLAGDRLSLLSCRRKTLKNHHPLPEADQPTPAQVDDMFYYHNLTIIGTMLPPLPRQAVTFPVLMRSRARESSILLRRADILQKKLISRPPIVEFIRSSANTTYHISRIPKQKIPHRGKQ